MTNGQMNMTLDQLCVLAAYERVMRGIESELHMLNAINKRAAVDKLEATLRHVGKHRDEHLKEIQGGIVVAGAGAIPDIKGTA